MLPRERVIQVIEHKRPDRVPVYGWVAANLTPQITEAFGSVAAFEDKYEFDFAHLFGGPGTWQAEALAQAREAGGGTVEPPVAAELPMADPNEMDAYQDIINQVRHHKEERGRFVYVQTPGIFEALNGVFGIQNHLLYLLMYPDDLKRVYARQAEWNIQFGTNCLDLGVDMVHFSDDWGSQTGLMFSDETWWEMIFPYHKRMVEAVKTHGGYASLHTDGNVNSVVDGIIQLGYDVVHPWQESAGMDLANHRANYADKFATMGGLDVQTTIGFGKLDFLAAEIERVLRLSVEGNQLYCTSHFVQDHCTMEELTFAFDTVYRLVRELATD